jgi:hypothetical protein
VTTVAPTSPDLHHHGNGFRAARSEGMAGNSKDDGRSVADKIIAIMNTFADAEERSNVQIARLAGLPVSTTHRLVGQLVSGGMLERTAHANYRVGRNFRAIARNGTVSTVGTGRART